MSGLPVDMPAPDTDESRADAAARLIHKLHTDRDELARIANEALDRAHKLRAALVSARAFVARVYRYYPADLGARDALRAIDVALGDGGAR